MDSHQLDVRHLGNLALPYDVETKELSDTSRLVGGSNTYITKGGKIAQAPGLNDTDLTAYTLAGRVDRLISYETVEAAPKVYLLASVYNGASWDAKYLRVGVGAWTSVGSLRGVNASLAPHEFVVAGGVVYIRFFAISGLLTVKFDGTVPTLTSWGLARPSSAPAFVGTFGVTTTGPIRIGWRYSYAYVNSTTGHISSRSLASVSTGAFMNANPRINVNYTTDTTVTHINIYRTMDGGGVFYFIDQIANNTAGGNTNYDDNASTLVAGDSVQDFEIDTRNYAPSEVSNEPPPVKPTASTSLNVLSGPIAYFARRIWLPLANRLFFSGQEEILNGVPEDSFPSPLGRGNVYVVASRIRQMKAARRALYVTTADQIMILVGQDLTNFFLDTHVPDIAGAAINNPGDAGHAIAAFRDSVFFLSADYQVYRVTGADPPELISGPLGTELRTYISTYAGGNTLRIEFEVFNRDGNNWLIINLANTASPELSRQYVFDLNRNLWFTPWIKPIGAMTFGRLQESGNPRDLIVMTYDGTTSKLAILDFNYTSDLGANFTPSIMPNLVTVPSGNHINELRKWAHSPMLSYVIIERTKFASDSDPTVTYRLDEFSGAMTSVTATDPPYLTQHASYYEKWYPVQKVCKRVQLLITGTAGQKFEIQNIGFVFQSEAGA